jgi:hypothetical protein
MRTPPKGYASTAVWAAFNKWADAHGLDREPDRDELHDWLPDWEAFRDGYSVGLAEQDV